MANPNAEGLIGLGAILKNLEILHCDMDESAVLPVALVNKLVSLADHPSSV
ncbi:MAG: hypothetical protein GQ563_07820 [Desulfuromusa sp.]|nr:hypothetical protein [Desulfuromusa sp.]